MSLSSQRNIGWKLAIAPTAKEKSEGHSLQPVPFDIAEFRPSFTSTRDNKRVSTKKYCFLMVSRKNPHVSFLLYILDSRFCHDLNDTL